MKLSFVCVNGGERARAETLFCLSLGAGTGGALLIEAAGIEKEREKGGGLSIFVGRVATSVGRALPADHVIPSP